jgi:hypothetical protein
LLDFSDLQVGAFVDFKVGALVDFKVGAFVDLRDGALVDFKVGAFVLLSVGALVDFNVGALVLLLLKLRSTREVSLWDQLKRRSERAVSKISCDVFVFFQSTIRHNTELTQVSACLVKRMCTCLHH